MGLITPYFLLSILLGLALSAIDKTRNPAGREPTRKYRVVPPQRIGDIDANSADSKIACRSWTCHSRILLFGNTLEFTAFPVIYKLMSCDDLAAS